MLNRGAEPAKVSEPSWPVIELALSHVDALLALESSGASRLMSPQLLTDALSSEQHRVLAVADGDDLLAYAVVARQPFDAELEAIMVAAPLRRNGLGTRLMKAVIETAQAWEVEHLLLEVRASNDSAIALYRSLGFQQDGARKGYYPPQKGQSIREDACLMSLAFQ